MRSTAASAVKAAFDGLPQAPVPALVVGKHAIGFEHVAMLSRRRQVLVLEHLVDVGLQLVQRRIEPLDLGSRVFCHQLRDDDARLVQHDVSQRNAFGKRFALDDRRLRQRGFDRSARSRHRARDEVLRDHHCGRLQNLDVFVRILLRRPVLNDEHAEHLARTRNRHRQQRMVDFFARLRPVGERRMARRLGLVDGHAQLRAPPDKAFPALHPRRMYRRGVEALGREKLERAVLALQIDRAHFRDHHAGDLAHDAIKLLLPLAAVGHDLAQPAHDDAKRGLARKGSWVVAPRYHYRAKRPTCHAACPGGSL